MTDKKERSYEVRLEASEGYSSEQIEALRGIGAVQIILTVDAPTRGIAIRETLDIINDFDATYHGSWPSAAKEDHVRKTMKIVPQSNAL